MNEENEKLNSGEGYGVTPQRVFGGEFSAFDLKPNAIVVFGIVQMLARGNPNPSRKITVKRIVEYGYPALNDRSAIDGIRQLVREGLVLVDRYGGGGLEVRPWYNPEWAPTRENPDRRLHGDPSPRREIKQRPPRRARGTKAPARPKTHQCQGLTKAGKRCRNMVADGKGDRCHRSHLVVGALESVLPTNGLRVEMEEHRDTDINAPTDVTPVESDAQANCKIPEVPSDPRQEGSSLLLLARTEGRSPEVCAAQAQARTSTGSSLEKLQGRSSNDHQPATEDQCHHIFATQYDRKWEWPRMAQEIEDITDRRVQNPEELTQDQASAVLNSLAADSS